MESWEIYYLLYPYKIMMNKNSPKGAPIWFTVPKRPSDNFVGIYSVSSLKIRTY